MATFTFFDYFPDVQGGFSKKSPYWRNIYSIYFLSFIFLIISAYLVMFFFNFEKQASFLRNPVQYCNCIMNCYFFNIQLLGLHNDAANNIKHGRF